MAYFNEMICALYLVLALCFLLLMFRLFSKAGLYLVVAFSIIIGNIQALKTVDLFGIQAIVGSILYGVVFLGVCLLGELYGKKEAQQGVLIGFLALLVFTVFIVTGHYLEPSQNNVLQERYESLFGLLPRVAAGSLVGYLVSQYLLVTLLFHMKESGLGKFLWFRANATIWMSAIIDTFLFSIIAFAGVLPLESLAQIIMSTLAIKVLVAVCGTSFLYLAIYLAPEKQVVRVWPENEDKSLERSLAAPDSQDRVRLPGAGSPDEDAL